MMKRAVARQRFLQRKKRSFMFIPASQYATWIAKYKSPNINQRIVRRLKNKLLKIFLKKSGVMGRIKTHDKTSSSFFAWKNFHDQFKTSKNAT